MRAKGSVSLVTMRWPLSVIRHPGRFPVGGETDGVVPGFEFFHARAGGGKGKG